MPPPDLVAPPEVDAALRARETGDPRRLVGFTFADMLLRARPHREVPQAHWVMHSATTTDPTRAAINCACGHGVTAEIGEMPAKCPGEDCPRSFFFDGAAVWALNTPAS